MWATFRPLYSLLISPACASRLVCSEIVLKLQSKRSAISSTVRPAFWATIDKISIRRWLATPFKCRSICFAVFRPFAILASYHKHSNILKNVGMFTEDGATPKYPASVLATALLAFPSLAGALTATANLFSPF